MIVSRILLSIALLLLGGMVYWLHLDLLKINDGVNNIKVVASAPIYSQGTGIVGKPKVPPIKHLVKRTPLGIPTDVLYYRCIGICTLPRRDRNE